MPYLFANNTRIIGQDLTSWSVQHSSINRGPIPVKYSSSPYKWRVDTSVECTHTWYESYEYSRVFGRTINTEIYQIFGSRMHQLKLVDVLAHVCYGFVFIILYDGRAYTCVPRLSFFFPMMSLSLCPQQALPLSILFTGYEYQLLRHLQLRLCSTCYYDTINNSGEPFFFFFPCFFRR